MIPLWLTTLLMLCFVAPSLQDYSPYEEPITAQVTDRRTVKQLFCKDVCPIDKIRADESYQCRHRLSQLEAAKMMSINMLTVERDMAIAASRAAEAARDLELAKAPFTLEQLTCAEIVAKANAMPSTLCISGHDLVVSLNTVSWTFLTTAIKCVGTTKVLNNLLPDPGVPKTGCNHVTATNFNDAPTGTATTIADTDKICVYCKKNAH